MVSTHPKFFYPSVLLKGPPLDKNHHVPPPPPFSNFLGAEVPIPCFTELISFIKSFKILVFSIHVSVSQGTMLWRYDVSLENILKYTIIK